jgi:hypothetical protein
MASISVRLSHRQDDPTLARDLAARDEEVSGGVVLLEERHVGRHVGVDLGEGDLVDQLDDEHATSMSETLVEVKWVRPVPGEGPF